MLGGRDSNPRYRDQNPASYRLDDPPAIKPRIGAIAVF